MTTSTSYEERTFHQLKDTLATAIQEVLESDRHAGRVAHQLYPHLRAKELNKIKNGDISGVGYRRLSQIADALRIKVKIEVETPKRTTN
ncbi:hypothetical protein [Pelagibacterium sp.]|uniref:hypothetical protein n=1 Tax=Pelagibacterium sp. TaxID=1967288 RepID=UPI003A9238D4